jgi:magnesium chelatase family protein
VTTAGLLGGGNPPRPGEVSFAHQGVLFLDELPEFRRDALEACREPLEEGTVTLVRARYAVRYPARFALVASMNPCPCGTLGDPVRPCRCTPPEVRRYQGKVSGPLLDRIDLHVEVPRVPPGALEGKADGLESAELSRSAAEARERAEARNGDVPNARLPLRGLSGAVRAGRAALETVRVGAERLGLSARAYHRVLRVARTAADLEGSEGVEPSHVAEALGYRLLDRPGWGKGAFG